MRSGGFTTSIQVQTLGKFEAVFRLYGEAQMSLRIRNRWKYTGHNWWEWEAFLDDQGSGELSRVKRVKYVLHPTFPESIREITDPNGGFVLKTGGWGEFELRAFVYLADGSEKKLTHEIELKSSPVEGVSG